MDTQYRIVIECACGHKWFYESSWTCVACGNRIPENPFDALTVKKDRIIARLKEENERLKKAPACLVPGGCSGEDTNSLTIEEFLKLKTATTWRTDEPPRDGRHKRIVVDRKGYFAALEWGEDAYWYSDREKYDPLEYFWKYGDKWYPIPPMEVADD